MLRWSTWNPLSRNGCGQVRQIAESQYAVLTTVPDPVKKDFREAAGVASGGGGRGAGGILNFKCKVFFL